MCVELKHYCQVCKARKGVECSNTIQPGTPLPGRRFHFSRALPPSKTDEEEE